MRLLFVDNSTCLRDVLDLERHARGGMVTSLFRVTDYLSRAGHDVYVWSDIENVGVTKAGTYWVQFPHGEFDVLVANRGTGSGYPHIKARSRVLWTHDLPHSGFIPEPRNAAAFFVVFMSHYAEMVWRMFYKDLGPSVTIPNGVDPIFAPAEKICVTSSTHRRPIAASNTCRSLAKR